MKTKTIEVYETEDGKQFYDEDAARKYERREELWNELHTVSDAGYGAHNLDDVVDYLMEFYELKAKS